MDLRGVVRVTSGIMRGRIPVESIYAELGRRPYTTPRTPGFFGQVLRFGLIGGISTVAYALLYLLFQLAIAPQLANFLALLVTAVANTWANRHFTFGVRGRDGFAGHQLRGLLVFLLAWGLTSGSLALLHGTAPESGPTVSLAVLTAANLVATALRFVALRWWVFRGRRRTPAVATTRHTPSSDPSTTANADTSGAATADPSRTVHVSAAEEAAA